MVGGGQGEGQASEGVAIPAEVQKLPCLSANNNNNNNNERNNILRLALTINSMPNYEMVKMHEGVARGVGGSGGEGRVGAGVLNDSLTLCVQKSISAK